MANDIYVKRNFLVGLETPTAPTSANDVANKTYVDNAVLGMNSVYDSVRAEAASNIDIATGGLLTIDGVTLLAGDRVLLTAQTTASENGIYEAASGAWSRASDMADASEVKAYSHVFVREGTTYGGHEMVLQTTNTSETVGTDALVWIHAYTYDNDSAHIDVDDSNFTVLTGTDVQTVIDDVDDKLADVATRVDTITGSSTSDLGTFTGSIITDNSSIKTALQELETELEGIDVTGQIQTFYDGQKFTQAGTTISASGWTTITHNLNETYPSNIQVFDSGNKCMTNSFDYELIDANSLRIQNEYPVPLTNMVVVVRA